MLDLVVMVLQLVGLALLVVCAWVVYWKAGVGVLGAVSLLVGYMLGREPSGDVP
jgi:hydrogenase/urease accessory protein HupE